MTRQAPKSTGIAESQADFARRLGVSRQRVNSMVRAGLPVVAGGLIDVERGLRWVKANITRKSDAAKTDRASDGVDLTEARRLKVLADTAMVKLLLDREKGDLVSKREVRLALAEFVRRQKAVIENFGNRYGAQLAAAIGADAHEVTIQLDLHMKLLLDDLHRQPCPKLPKEDDVK